MDLGVVAVGGGGGVGVLNASDGCFSTLPSSDHETRHKLYGSGLLIKQEERSASVREDDWRSFKMTKTSDGVFQASSKAMQLQQRGNGSVLRSGNSSSSSLFFSDAQPQQQMLCFSSAPSPSSPKSEAMLIDRSSESATLPFFQHSSSPLLGRSTGFTSASLNGTSILTGIRGPFTASQWMELEHQALIYKYITANIPIPSNLLIPIRRALESAAFSPFGGGSFRPTSLGWGSFHLGFSSSNDPEPGRCRRTDGKKWRCSKDAVADQKYCERHMNRGRHRSRKPVEGQTGHSAARSTATTTRLTPVAASLASVVASGRSASNSLANVQHQVDNLRPCGESNPSAASHINSCKTYESEGSVGGDKMRETVGLSVLSSTNALKARENSFSITKHPGSYEGSSQTEFGFVTSDSLLNPSHKSSTFMNGQSFGTSQEPGSREPESQHSLRPFTDNWPKFHSDHSATSWPETSTQSDRTQLSISTPLASSSFMSATSSPTNNIVTLSPLRLSCEIEPIQMGLGVGNADEPNDRQANWIPISWGASVGGPLGEVLHSTNNSSAGDCKNSSALDLTIDGWDSSPRLVASPTGVLQKATFASLSNSSAGSSPRPENSRTHEGLSLCNDLLGTTLVHSLPLL